MSQNLALQATVALGSNSPLDTSLRISCPQVSSPSPDFSVLMSMWSPFKILGSLLLLCLLFFFGSEAMAFRNSPWKLICEYSEGGPQRKGSVFPLTLMIAQRPVQSFHGTDGQTQSYTNGSPASGERSYRTLLFLFETSPFVCF